MNLIPIVSQLVNLGAVSWPTNVVYTICLWILGAIFNLVSYVYSLFIIMCGLNLDSVTNLAANLINNIEALVMVFVVFKVGVALIGYMLEPERASKDGTKLVVNILITAALLIGRNFVFGVFNDLSLLIMGNPTAYPLNTLSTVAKVTGVEDEGLIMRFVFGKSDKQDIGDYLAIKTVSIVVHDYNDPESAETVRKAVSTSSGYNFLKLSNLSSEVNQSIEYHPIIGSFIGLFLIYSLVKASIEIGVRLFKMLILQMLSPLAIISCVGDGLKAEKFRRFTKTYLAVWVEAFTRMLVMLIVVVFVCKIFINIDTIFAGISSENGFKKGLVIILIVVAAFKFAGTVPKFVDEVLGTNMAGSDSKGGFGKFLGGLVGGGIGFAAGVATGNLAGAVTGLAGGISSGSKGKGIADFFKGQAENSAHARNVAANARMAGGPRAYAASRIGGFFGIPQRTLEQGKLASERQSAMDSMVQSLEDYYDAKVKIGNDPDSPEISLTRDLYKNYAYDPTHDFYKELDKLDASGATREAVDQTHAAYEKYKEKQGKYDQLRMSGTASEQDLAAAWAAVEDSRTAYQSLKSNSDSKLDTAFNTRMIRDAREGKNIKAKGTNAVRESIRTYDNVASEGYTTADFASGQSNTKKAKDYYTTQQDETTHSRRATTYTNTQHRN